ncbi:MAG: glycosyltransferase family 4 protein [Reichenbachiella sp.]|uniref:glycosyltransferase family 4 protein n=1 Tax=Reichenbachiella sp. TaxID=2184521 RepID=UPI00329A7973
MTIAVTVNTSWNIYNFRMGLIRALLKQGNKIIAIAPQDDYSKNLVEDGCQFVPIVMDNTGSNPFKDYSLYRQLKRIYKDQKPDIVFHYTVKPNIYGTLAAYELKIPVINNVSGLGTVFLNKGIASFVAKKLYQKAFSHAELVFFQNSDDHQLFLMEIPLPNLQTDLLPGSGINLSEFSVSPIIGEEKVFLMIARLIKDKGVLEYLEAAELTLKKYPKSKFQLLGKLDPNHARGIPESIISEAHNNSIVKYLGETDDVKPYIEKATCVVLPSYREGTPRTLLEAAAIGRPIITTNVAGCKEVVSEGETGLLCEERNALDLSEKINTICEMPQKELSVMGKNGRQLIESKFDEQIVINQYLKHLSNIMNQLQAE